MLFLPIMMTSLMTSDELILSNIPHLRDVTQALQLLANIGVERSFAYENSLTLSLKASHIETVTPDAELVQSMRASVMVLGPLLARHGEVHLYDPGGCVIGSRPIDLHLKAMQALGAEIVQESNYVVVKAARLKGNVVNFPIVTVTGTENAICAACLADGESTINNAAIEPEVGDLIDCLNNMGAKIHGKGTHSLTIEGVHRLHGNNHAVITDRIEAGTYICAAAITGGEVEFTQVPTQRMGNILELLQRSGV